ncbi:MAG: hypothetical protein ACT4P0_00110 [Panacagrimonas sp.]
MAAYEVAQGKGREIIACILVLGHVRFPPQVGHWNAACESDSRWADAGVS